MTKEITKAIVLQQIQDKFSLREFEPAPFLFDETVVPVYNIGTHFKHFYVQEKTESITSASGTRFFTVPDTERWIFSNYNITFMTGTYTVTGLYSFRIRTSEFNSIYFDQELGRSGSYAINLPTPVVLNPGDTLEILVDGYTATGDLRLTVDTEVEEIR